jgi:hypothetical protein
MNERGIKIEMGVFPTIYLLLFKDKNCIYYENIFT